MKHILIIEDDQVVANVYRNKLAVEGYKVEVAQDGESGLRVMRTFKPQLILLDLMLPTISGVDVIREIRSEEDFARTPIIVFSNTYLTNLIQEAWRAGANKCLSKSSCTPKDVIEVVRHTIGDSGAMPQKNAPPAPANAKTAAPAAPAANLPPAGPVATEDEDILETSPADLKQNFLSGLPVTLGSLRTGMQALIKADSEMLKLKQIYELYRVVHTLNGNASVAGMTLIAHMSAALEALLKEIYEKPKNINSSTTRTIAGAIDFLGLLFEKGVHPDQQDLPASRILVVDDEAISRRAIIYALEKARLKSTNLDDPVQALQQLTDHDFDLVFLDVDMPSMNGYELCGKLRALPRHKKTPVVFITSMNDFENRANSTMAGGNDFIGKPLLFIELTVKALMYVLRSQLQSRTA